MAIFCGGVAQLLAGMWEFPRGNAFGGTGKLVFVVQGLNRFLFPIALGRANFRPKILVVANLFATFPPHSSPESIAS